jgi:hypothetical protein
MDRSIFVLAGEYSARPDDDQPSSVFRRAPQRPAGADRHTEPEPGLDELLFRACRRALDSVGEDLGAHVDHLLVTTMPHGEDASFERAVNLPNRLKRRLGLTGSCKERFEIGTSDAGAAVFASAVHLLRGLPQEATALVAAGQTMWGGRLAIQTVARVLEDDERAFGMNMIAVGDLLMERFAQAWRREGRLADGTLPSEADAAAMVDTLVRKKLELATEYPCAQRSGAAALPPDGPWISPWLKRDHVAPASIGACAVVLTTDEHLVSRWVRAGGRFRVVRVLGVGEGDANVRVTHRPEPFGYGRSVRQALHQLCRVTGTNLDFVRASSFAVIHDAFPSIEMAFLAGLGFGARQSAQRSMTWWPNPYGGLTSFGHALGASGLVQVAKAFHIFTRPEAWLPHVEGPSWHGDFSTAADPMHCLTTSVGGPLTHVVTTMLQSVPVDDTGAFPGGWVRIKPPSPRKRHRYDLERDDYAPLAARWVREVAWGWRIKLGIESAERCGPGESMGVLEGRTALDMRGLPHPLPAAFVQAWSPSFRRGGTTTPLPDDFIDELRAALLDPDEPLAACKALVKRRGVEVARTCLAAAGDPDEGLADGAARAAVFASLQVPIGLVTDPRSDPGATPHRLCLLAGPCADAEQVPTGSLLRLVDGPEVLSAAVSAEELLGLVPPWYLAGEGPTVRAPLFRDPDRVEEIVTILREERPTTTLLEEILELASELLAPLTDDPTAPPPDAARQLFGQLVWQSEPDRWVLADALAELAGLVGHLEESPTLRRMAYIEFDVVAASGLSRRRYVENLEAIVLAIRRAEGWFGGARIHFDRLRDGLAVTVWDPRLEQDSCGFWPLVVRFARDVYQSCLDRGFPIRTTCCIDMGSTVDQVVGRLGGAGRVQLAAFLGLQSRRFRRRRRANDPPTGDERADGIAVVLPEDGSCSAGCDDHASIWARAGGEVLEAVDAGPLEVQGQAFRFEVRRRPDLAVRGEALPPEPSCR